jgi:hypothetical protein
MGVGDWIRRIFSSNEGEEEAVEREEYGLPEREDRETQRGRLGSFAGAEASEAAAGELDEFKAPRDPAP